MIKQCLQNCFKKGKAKTDDSSSSSSNNNNNTEEEEDWGTWDDDIENQTLINSTNNSQTSSSRKRSGSGNKNSPGALNKAINVGNTNSNNNLYANSVNPAVRNSRPRNTSWMKKNKNKNNNNNNNNNKRGGSSSSTIFASKKAEDIFADMGIERRNISKQSKMRVQKRIELKGNVSSRFVDDTDTNDIDDEGWGD